MNFIRFLSLSSFFTVVQSCNRYCIKVTVNNDNDNDKVYNVLCEIIPSSFVFSFSVQYLPVSLLTSTGDCKKRSLERAGPDCNLLLTLNIPWSNLHTEHNIYNFHQFVIVVPLQLCLFFNHLFCYPNHGLIATKIIMIFTHTEDSNQNISKVELSIWIYTYTHTLTLSHFSFNFD